MIIERNGKKWHWPDDDKKLIQVFDWVSDIDYFLQFVKGRDVVIQAGGACGQWPAEFSKHFESVLTFEPQKDNFDCLKKNIEGIENISAYRAALDSMPRKIDLYQDSSELHNNGAYYAKPGSQVASVTIDSLHLDNCDLIQLDVEGFEYYALKGGEQTIKKYKPVIVVEEKPLPHIDDYTLARRLLELWGYKQVGQIHRDVVFKC